MILYSLACDAGHRFDSWFRDSAAFDEQAAGGQVSCPFCGTSHVGKTIMAPALCHTGRLGSGKSREPLEAEASEASAAEPAMSNQSRDLARFEPGDTDARAMLKALRAKIVAEHQDVGRRFAEEARRMHFGEKPMRQIRGQASADEALSLLDDGIVVLPLPPAPEDLN